MDQRKQIFIFTCCLAFGFTNGEYNGKLIATFSDQTQHQVAGTVYAVDNDTIRIVGFTFDGNAPDAFVWGGDSDNAPSTNGFIIGSSTPLGEHRNEDIDVDLPSGKKVSMLKWISIWCRQFTVSFNHVTVPDNFQPPAETDIGQLGPGQHDVFANSVVIVNDKQIRFEGLIYDGEGPDAFFWAGEGDSPSGSGFIIPDERGESNRLREYSGQTITITLPDEETVFTIGHVGIWCRQFSADFGHIDVPAKAQLNIPPFPLSVEPPLEFTNCESLVDGELQVSWVIDGDNILIRLQSVGTSQNQYVAFGVSGSTTANQMVGGDVAVTFIDGEGRGQAIDYYLSSQAQCSPQNGAGACPDTVASDQADDNVIFEHSSVRDGITTIEYKRPLVAQDATYDKAIPRDQSIYVIWARGSINPSGTVSYHNTARTSPTANLQINFGRASSTCGPLNRPSAGPPLEPWIIPRIVARQNTTFNATMGLAGGKRGYEGITGMVGWGIAWFIDELLIPELVVERGRTYTFLVSGGNDSTESAKYHPFYITGDENGGYAQAPAQEQEGVTIYAGPVEGPLCEWKNGPTTQPPETYDTFEAFRGTLMKECMPGNPGKLVWTVAEDTPDLVYYHCYTHRFLGWKIHVLDAGEPLPTLSPRTSEPPSTTASAGFTSSSILLLLALLIAAIFLH